MRRRTESIREVELEQRIGQLETYGRDLRTMRSDHKDPFLESLISDNNARLRQARTILEEEQSRPVRRRGWYYP